MSATLTEAIAPSVEQSTQATKKGGNKRKYDSLIHFITELSSSTSNLNAKASAKLAILDMQADIEDRLNTEAVKATQCTKRKTMSSDDVYYAAKVAWPESEATVLKAIAFAKARVAQYHTSKQGEDESKSEEKGEAEEKEEVDAEEAEKEN